MNSKKPIVIISPMDCEFLYLADKLEKKREIMHGGYLFLQGECNGCPTVLIRCLIGTVNSAVCTALACEKYDPSCIILQGTSGGHNPSLKKNDIVIAKRVVGLSNCVSKHRDGGCGSNPLDWEIYGVESYFKKDGRIKYMTAFDCDKTLVDLALSVPYEYGSVTVGTIAASDIWNKEIDLILHHNEAQGSDCEAMEGFGVAQVCAVYDVPMTEIRVISNSELNEGEEFTEDTAENCQKFVWEYLKVLAASEI